VTAAAAATTVTPSSQPPSTSVAQCTSSATRVYPIESGTSTAATRANARAAYPTDAGIRSSNTPQPTAAIVACPDGNARPAAPAWGCGGRGRCSPSLTPVDSALPATAASSVNTAALARRRSQSQPATSASNTRHGSGPAIVLQACTTRTQAGCAVAKESAPAASAVSRPASGPRCTATSTVSTANAAAPASATPATRRIRRA
jgi:hypothetical protein